MIELPDEAVLAISADLDALLDHPEPGLRSAAVALKVRAGAPLQTLAERDATALLDAVAALPAEGVPPSVPDDLVALVENNKVDRARALDLALHLSTDLDALFKRLAGHIDAAQAIAFDSWGNGHLLAMASLNAMHSVPDEDWPAGYDDYKLARASAETFAIGKQTYYLHEKGCAKCHGEHGEGTEGFPPLAGSPNLLGSPVRVATIVKYGRSGELPHTLNPADGKPFSAQMEPLSYFSDGEMAAALTFARQSFGNFAEPVTVEDVKAARGPKAEDGEGEMMWNASALLKAYPLSRDRVLGSAPPPQPHVVHWKAPAMGVWYMLLVVAVAMGLIWLPTYFASGLAEPHGPAHA